MNIAPNCRQPEDLQRFLLGQLSADEADQVQAHLAGCPRCLDTVAHMQASDTLIEAFRAQARAPSQAEEDVVGGLINKLSGVCRSSDTSAGDGTSPGGSQPGEPSAAFAVLAPAQAADEIGRLGDYRVLKVLGAGGMGIVFEAEDPHLRRHVALKVMKPALAQDAANRLRFLREAQATAAIEHDHIVTIHQVGEDGGVPFLTMQLLRGETLDDTLRRPEATHPLPVGEGRGEGVPLSPLPLVEVLRIAREIAEGLAAAHAQGLTHRDIKPANIWLERSGRVKILDFGLARPEQDDAHLTQTGNIAGTPQYMAPEQAAGQPVDHLSDLFSLGCVLYRLLTGRLPFRGSNTMAVLRSLALDQPPPPREVNPDLPPTLSDLTMRLLAKDPRDRPQTAEAVAAELALIGRSHLPDGTSVGASGGGPARQAGPTLTGRPTLMAATALFLLIAGPLAAWYAPTVYRIATNQGLLVIETDDDAVEVTVKQNGKLVKLVDRKTGREVTLKAGVYQLELSGDNRKQGLTLETNQFTLIRGGREIARVRREPAAAPVPIPPTATPPESPALPFVVLPSGDRAEQTFATLAESVAAASSGDTIEVRGNGPMIREPIFVTGKALTIRAAPGNRPVVEFSAASLGEGFANYVRLQTDAPLVLEGLEIRRVGATGEKVKRAEWALVCRNAPVRMANCRFVVSTQPGTTALWADRSAFCEVRNCQFVLGQGCTSVGWTCPSTGRLIWDNNVTAGGGGPGIHIGQRPQEISVQMTRSTILWGPALYFNLTLPPQAALGDGNQPATPCRLEVAENVFHSGYVLGFFQDFPLDAPETKAPTAAEAEVLLPRLVAWHGQRNLYPDHLSFLGLGVAGETLKPSVPRRTLEDLRQLWGPTETDSLQGRILFQGGEVATNVYAAPEQFTPGDVRLHADSAGKGAGEGSRDLGADVDLVGPGPAYESWKQTPAYQKWLKDIGQIKAEAVLAERVFVIPARDARAEQKFATMADAVAAATTGDTIEIRTNGPIITPPLSIPVDGLTIRAAPGFVPVVQLQTDDSSGVLISNSIGSLVLEGLELRLAGFAPAGSGGGPRIVNCSGFGRIHIANCLLHVIGVGRSIRVEGGRSLVQVRNSLVFGPIWFDGERLVAENNACCSRQGPVCGSPVNIGQERSLQFQRCTLVGSSIIEFLDSIRGAVPDDGPPPLRCEVANCILDGHVCVLSYVPWARVEGGTPALPAEARSEILLAAFKRRVSWQGEHNAYPANVSLLGRPESVVPARRIKTLADWNAYWEVAEEDAVQGLVKFQAGDVRDALEPTPQAFRLLPGSLGSGAANGKDLGADADLVGPGAAYEKWRQSPAYQDWLKASGQTP